MWQIPFDPLFLQKTHFACLLKIPAQIELPLCILRSPRNISGRNFDKKGIAFWECRLGRPEFCFAQGSSQNEHLGEDDDGNDDDDDDDGDDDSDENDRDDDNDDENLNSINGFTCCLHSGLSDLKRKCKKILKSKPY